jgi:septal ring factor EnvC (AmiA/AmiB activator)
MGKVQAGVAAVLVALVAGTFLLYLGARDARQEAESDLARVTEALREERAKVAELEDQVDDLEAEANGAALELVDLRATAARCATELLRATTAALRFRYSMTLFWIREGRRTCAPLIGSGATAFS